MILSLWQVMIEKLLSAFLFDKIFRFFQNPKNPCGSIEPKILLGTKLKKIKLPFPFLKIGGMNYGGYRKGR